MFNKYNETKQRFAIKKYTFGVASALVGVFFFAGANAAQAQEVQPATSPVPTSVSTATQPASQPVASGPVESSNLGVTNPAPAPTSSVVTPPAPVANNVPTPPPAVAPTSPVTKAPVSEKPLSSKTTQAAVTDVKPSSSNPITEVTNKEVAPAVGQAAPLAFSVTDPASQSAPAVGEAPRVASSVQGRGELLDPTAVVNIPMSDANGATVKTPARLEALLATGEYKVDPDPNRLTYSILNFSANAERWGDPQYYLTFSRDKDPLNKSTEVFINLVNKNGHVIEERLSFNDYTDTTYRFKTLDALKDNPWTAFYDISGTASIDPTTGFEKRVILITAQPDSNAGTTSVYSLASKIDEGVQQTSAQAIATNYSAQNTYYVAKFPDGSTKNLARWTNIGWVGESYTISGERQFEGYELIESPKVKEGDISVRPAVGFKFVNSRYIDVKGKYLFRQGEVVNPNGDVIYHIVYSTDKDPQKDYPASDVLFTTEVIPPGGVSGAGDMALPVGRIIYPGGRYSGLAGNTFHLRNTFATFDTDAYYYYAPQGTVTVHYVDEQGNVIKDAVLNTKPSLTGTAYDVTVANKPTEIEKDGVKYFLKAAATEATVGGKTVVEVKDGVVVGPEAGNVAAGTTTNVIYVYEKAGNVLVNYVDEQGNVLQPAVENTPATKSGTAYDITPANKPAEIEKDGVKYFLKAVATEATVGGKTVVEVKDGVVVGPEAGNVAAGTTTNVIYVYEKAGNVLVNYKDEAGTVLKPAVEDTPATKSGTAYDTAVDNKPTEIVTQDGKTYELVKDKTVGAEQGLVEAGKTTEVTYVYREVKGNVLVNYKDEAGNVIQAQAQDTTEASTGTAYDTTDLKSKTIITPEGKTYELVADKTEGKEVGTVVKGTTEITYVYKEILGSVVVNYVSETGEELQTPVTDTANSSTGIAYDTKDNKPTRITTADGRIFDLVEDKTQGTEVGKVSAGETKVTYVYREVKGNVLVNYKDEAGNEIQAPVEDTVEASIGSDYNTTDNKPTEIITPEGKTYELLPTETKGAENGKVTEALTEITYVYKEVKGSVLVNYTDEAGNVIQDQAKDTTEASTGTAYDTTDLKQETIVTADGKTYELVADKTQGTETGKVVKGNTQVTYIYKEVKGNVLVRYVDQAGNEIQAPVEDTLEASTGSVYDTTDNKPNRITSPEGKTYELVPDLTQGTETGKVTKGNTQVTYVYKEIKGSVLVNYTDEAGNVLQPAVTDLADVSTGTDYDTSDNKQGKIITTDGKTYVLVPDLTKGAEAGKVTEGRTEVTYVYREVTGNNIIVNYVDESGNVIKEPVTDTKDSSTGVDYDTTDNKPNRITSPDGKTYELIPTATKGTETGKVVEGNTQVTYVYKEIKGNVVVNYTDEAGNVISPKFTGTDLSTGSDYNVSDKKLTTITTQDGRTYVLVPDLTKGKETGKVTEGTTEVTYVYREVTTSHLDSDGKELSPKTNGTTGKVSIEGYTLVETKKTPEGDTIHVYRPVTTTFVDQKGNVLSPGKDGKHPFANLEGYTLVETKTTPEGDTVHVYRPVTTSFVDEKGNVLSPGKDGKHPYANLEGYTLVETKATPEGDTIHVYRPVTTTFVDQKGNVLSPGKDGKHPYANLEGYTLVETKKTPEGDTVHVYRPVTTSFVDQKGNVLSPGKDGKHPFANLEGYTLVETKKTPEGDTIHVYRPVTTTFVDQNGNVLSPGKDGKHPYANLDGYTLVETKKTPEGDTIHVYRPVTTTFVDQNGNVLSPGKDGKHPYANLEGYTLVETKKTPEGDTVHVYRPVTTSFVDEKGNVLSPGKDGKHPFANLDGYTLVETKITPEGDTVHVYRPVTTTFVDEKGNVLAPGKDGKHPYANLDGYTLVETKTTPEGDTVHVYRPVTTTFVDEKGKVLSPGKDGKHPYANLDGYTLVETKKTPEGDTIHVYRPVTTTFVDEKGNVLAPGKDGKHPYANLEGYTLLTTQVDPATGDTKHIYRPVTTSFVDQKGNVLAPGKDGKHPYANLDGYTLVETKKTPEGDTIHVYRPVTTSFVDEKGNVLSPGKVGKHPYANLEGYALVATEVDPLTGDTKYIYRKIEGTSIPAVGVPFPTVELPAAKLPVIKPTVKPVVKPVVKPIAKPKSKPVLAKKVAKAGVLPKTSAAGTETKTALPAGLAAALAAAGLLATKRRKED